MTGIFVKTKDDVKRKEKGFAMKGMMQATSN